MNLEDVRARLTADDADKGDALVERAEIRLQGGRVFYGTLSPSTFPDGLGLTPWATAQLCQRLNVPTAYFRRCPPLLQDAQMNHWLFQLRRRAEREKPERWLLRRKGGLLRGVLSEKYTRVGNAEVLEALLPVLSGRFEVGWLAITEESLHLRLLDPTLSRDVLPGDRVVAGLHIGNSEVGKRAVTVDALVWRLVCQNGLIRLVKGRSLLHQRHIHLSSAALSQALQKAVCEALVQGTGFMERMAWATREKLPDREAAVKRLADRWHLSEALAAKVAVAWRDEAFGQGQTLYGLVNALTLTAQELAPDERYTLETLSGMLLEKGFVGLPAASPQGVATEQARLVDGEGLFAFI